MGEGTEVWIPNRGLPYFLEMMLAGTVGIAVVFFVLTSIIVPTIATTLGPVYWLIFVGFGAYLLGPIFLIQRIRPTAIRLGQNGVEVRPLFGPVWTVDWTGLRAVEGPEVARGFRRFAYRDPARGKNLVLLLSALPSVALHERLKAGHESDPLV